MFKQWIVLSLTILVMLSACHSPVYNQTTGNVADVKLRTAAGFRKSDNDAKPAPPLVVQPGLYVDKTPVSLASSPTWLHNHVIIRGDQLPFSYYSRIIATGANSGVLIKYQTGLDASTLLSMNYTGTVKGALDVLAARTGYTYVIHRNSIEWQALITRTFDIAFMPGAADYLMGKKSGGSGTASSNTVSGSVTSSYVSGDDSNSEYSNLSGKLSIWDDIEKTITQLLSPDGRVIVSQATTSVTVRDKAANINLIAQYISNMNNKLTRQVLVKVQVLEVTLENDFTFGINWGLIVNAFKNSPFVVNANYGTPVSITSFTPQATVAGVPIPVPQFGFNPQQDPNGAAGAIPSYLILLNALNQQGHASVVTEPRVVCLNNQVSVIRIVDQQGYLASVQNTTVAGNTASAGTNTVTSQLTPGTVITGLTLYILPKILNNNIYLQVNADLSTAGKFTDVSSGGPNSVRIQVPNIQEKHFNQRSVIKSGDTLILAGFKQVSNTANANQFITSQALGGKGSQQLNKEIIMLITPFILNGSV